MSICLPGRLPACLLAVSSGHRIYCLQWSSYLLPPVVSPSQGSGLFVCLFISQYVCQLCQQVASVIVCSFCLST